MKVTDLHLRNIRSYEDESIAFPEGTMLVHGENGAGKTTLLMGIFGGLFLSNIRNVGANDFNLDDIVRRGTREGEIVLTFEVAGTPYTVTWSIDTEGQNRAELDSPALSEPISGIRDVSSEVVDVVGMDEDSFSRSVYVQQGEVDSLFDDDARAELIDDLLGLDRIDRYELWAKGARRAMGRIASENEQSAENHRETIDEQFDHDVEGYEAAIADKEAEISEQQAEIEEVEEFLQDLRDAKEDVEQRLENHDELQTELEQAKDEREELVEERAAKQREIEDAQTAIAETETEVDTLHGDIDEKQEALDQLDDPSTTDPIDADLSTEERAEEALSAAQDAVETAQIEHTDREGTLDRVETERDRLIDERDALREEAEELEADLDHLLEEKDSISDDVETAEEDVAAAVEKRDAVTTDFLPDESCPDTIADETRETIETRVEALTTEKNELSEERAAAEASLEAAESTREQMQAAVTDARDERDQLSDDIAEVESELEAAREAKTEAENQFDEELQSLDADLATVELSVSGDTLQSLIDNQIPEAKGEIQDAIETANTTVTELKARQTALEEDREELQALDGVATCPKCGQDVDPSHVETELADIEAELTEIESDLAEARKERDELLDRRDALDECREEAIELRGFRDDMVEVKAERVSTLEDECESLQDDHTEAESELADAEAKLESAESEVNDLEHTIADLNSDIESLEAEIEDGEEVVAAFETVEERRQERDDLADELADLEAEREELEAEIADADTELDDYDEQIEAQRDAVAGAKAALEDAQQAVHTAMKQRELVVDVVDAYDEIDELETAIAGHQKDIGHAQDTIENLNAQIAGVEDNIDELTEELGSIDVEAQRDKLETASRKIEEREATVEELNAELDSLKEARTVLENDLENLEYFRERLALEEEKRKWAEERSDEFDRMMAVYRSTKADLREQYLAYINQYTNDIFSDIYKNSSYQQVRILEEGPDGTPYAIQLLRDDGTLEHPSNASGGERAIVNLALRAGIYKLIAEMREGDSGRLPPFILDEPTTFLDKGHIGRLEQMLDSIAEWDVPQVIVVSHDERLIQGAEHEIEVSIDEETNASRVDVHRGGRIPGDE
ncbi:AAA family ATPase [Halorubrum vacuolatum]|uniref:DNA repair exonuclease SbcCD ATPase subunit n=1 Tax=Halorubrum vacuolatum TaxID=63740 RepID=A0A238XEC3_HALVU|nr:AAA family ATPase [Halorubrum vacuolatum]SNR57032.1 DNA repair exonuclease SbcCD ATPase subunit [Halorubrum vacuolatum]